MTESEQFEATRLFLAALGEVKGSELILFDPLVFALCVKALKDNSFAQQFSTSTTIMGMTSWDFQEGMSLAQAGRVMTRQNPRYTHFTILMTPQKMQALLERDDAAEIRELAAAYLERVSH